MKKQLLSICMVFITTMLMAQWNGDSTVNNAICTFSNTTQKSSLLSISNDNGGMWIVWEETRYTSGTDLYCQLILPNGTTAFPDSGVVISNAIGNQSSASLTTDGAGGIVVSWTDTRTTSTTSNDIYAQRIDATGVAVWTANGIPVVNTTSNELASAITRLNSNQLCIVWRDDRANPNATTGQDYFANALSITNGSKLWTTDLEVVRAANTQSNIRLLPDGLGNAYAVWQDPRIATTNSDIYIQKINNDGTAAWAANGINLTASATFNQANARIISDGVGGIIVTWDDNRNTNNDQDIYAQRIDKDGNIKWTAGGVVVAAVASSNQRSPYMTTDGKSGAIITWQDTRSTSTTNNDIYVQRIDSNGVVKWLANGVLVCNAGGSQPNSSSDGFSINEDGAGGAIIVWDDARIGTSDLDVFAQRIDEAGAVLWKNNGIGIASKTGSNQRVPTVVKSNGNSLIITWADGRTTTNGEIYASNLLLTGVLPLTFNSIAATTKNSTVVVNWQTSNEVNTNNFVVQRSADGTQFYNVGTVKANGIGGKYAFTDFAPLQGSNYYRIQSLDKDGFTQLSSTVKANTESLAIAATVRVYPNPTVTNTLQVQFNKIELGNYFAKIIDMNGRLLQQEKMSIQSGSTSKNIQLNNAIQAGNYMLQIIDTEGKIIGSKTFTKQ